MRKISIMIMIAIALNPSYDAQSVRFSREFLNAMMCSMILKI